MKNLIQSEIKKIFFLKFSKNYLISMIAMGLALGIIFSLTTNVTQGKAITELSPMDIVSTNMLGVDLANVMLIIFTALSISKEFSTDAIYVSLVVTPNRKKFFASKMITYFLLSIVVSIVMVALTYLTSQLILSVHGMSRIAFQNANLRQFLLGVSVMPVFYCLLAVAATFIFESSGGSITFSLGIMAIPALIKMFSSTIQKLVMPILPQSAIHSLSGVAEQNSFESLGIFFSICILLAWIILVSLIAVVKFQKQDI
ncbi:ABC transporter permease [Sporosalibacterium faouarense]|uniref:ABC transporter permease n=1 Tax=Sporosalibacterium faouarense TaxID=516123 RepID=UPI00141D3490|nr:ABC transporter permease [Sporosalibacterium faouarense]MTI46384.1 hypothetical protein [Bacillota bacterium]